MLFNSFSFVFLFLPATLAVFFALARVSRNVATWWLAFASFIFYGAWDARFVPLLAASVAFNCVAGRIIERHRGEFGTRLALFAGVTCNLLLLGYFKYAAFLVGSIAALLGSPSATLDTALPLGISFFTFTQIAYLVDAHRGATTPNTVGQYAVFATYFPHLIAGPVIHHGQLIPQLRRPGPYRPAALNFAVGLSLFAIGLSKKVLLADRLGDFATPVFVAAQNGATPLLVEAWTGALAYTFQLYFDFSGYSDMALGAARMMGIRLPVNFRSPYKARNIIEFWRRWHVSLSTFLRDYLYIPLGGNRRGPLRRYVNLFLTMLLGGLWHGAAWTFVAWGALHGTYLIINHAFRRLADLDGPRSLRNWKSLRWAARIGSVALTFLAVVVAWVLFRAESFDAAGSILLGMTGMNGITLPMSLATLSHSPAVGAWLGGVTFGGAFAGNAPLTALGGSRVALLLFASSVIVWAMPNSQEWLHRYRPTWQPVARHRGRLDWKPTLAHGLVAGCLLAAAVLGMNRTSEFLYYQF
jgi:alginate O-acetyltransferase complex protein AlgI